MRRSSIAGVMTVSAIAAFGLVAPATMAATTPTTGVEVAWKVDSSWNAGFQNSRDRDQSNGRTTQSLDCRPRDWPPGDFGVGRD